MGYHWIEALKLAFQCQHVINNLTTVSVLFAMHTSIFSNTFCMLYAVLNGAINERYHPLVVDRGVVL